MNLSPHDIARYLRTDRERLEYLRAAVTEAEAGIAVGGDALILKAVSDILRSMAHESAAA